MIRMSKMMPTNPLGCFSTLKTVRKMLSNSDNAFTSLP